MEIKQGIPIFIAVVAAEEVPPVWEAMTRASYPGTVIGYYLWENSGKHIVCRGDFQYNSK